jgi:subtilisin-like proprotein convertase family protein
MKKFLFYSLGLVLGVFSFASLNAQTVPQTPVTVTSTNASVACADPGTTTVQLGTITLPAPTTPGCAKASATYKLSKVSVAMSHTWASDLTLTLNGPGGQSYTLLQQEGGSSDFVIANPITYTNGATNTSPTGASPYAAQEIQPNTPFPGTFAASTFYEGAWTLVVNDAFGGDAGTVGANGVTFTFDAECAPATAGPSCLLVCSGDQTITLPGGACQWEVPNLVTLAGNCQPSVVPGRVTRLNTSPWEVNTFAAFDLFPWAGFPPASGRFLINKNTLQAGPAGTTPMMDLSGTATAPNFAALLRGKNGVGNYSYVTMIRLGAIPYNGTLAFNWVYDTDDSSALWDPFAIEYNQAPGFLSLAQTTWITNPNIGDQSGSYSAQVTAGSTVQIFVWSQDNFGGEARATINNLRLFEPDVIKPWVIQQTKGPKAGDFIGAGSYESCYELLNPAGVKSGECCFKLNVREFPNPVKSLVCNDHVNISADANCQVTLDADMFLEGGPYACYRNYKINIWPFNSQANAINNVPQGTPLNLPTGEHTYEVVSPEGIKCWGTFIVEDKTAPVAQCSCQDIEIITPVTSFTGSLVTTDTRYNRCGGFAGFPSYYDVYSFKVSATGSYTFNAANSNGDLYAYIFANNFDPNTPCANIVAQDDDTAGGLDPLITTNLTAGTQYYYVITEWATPNAQGAYNVNITSTAGQVLTITNPSLAAACQLKCYDLEVVKRETVGILYNLPGNHKSKLTTPPSVTDGCTSVNRAFEDRIVSNNCGASFLFRDWTFTDAFGNKSSCTQKFTFNQIKISDLTLPTKEVQLTCGTDADPASVAGYTDVDSRTGSCSTTPAGNSGTFCDDWNATPAVVELHEGFLNAYPTYGQIGFDGNFHPQKVDNSVCNIYSSYVDQMVSACGLGCGGNMKTIRTWTLLDWCTGATATYVQFIKAVDEKAPTFDVADVTVSVDPWGCVATWNVAQPANLQDNCVAPSEIKWSMKVPAGVALNGTQPNYVVSNMPIGRHAFTYTAVDCCGNVSEKVAFVTVVDASAPVAVAKQNIVLSLTGSGTGADGTAKLYAWQVNNGSYDHCTDVKVEIRRVSGGSCGNVGADGTHNNNSTFNDNNGVTSETPGQTWFHNPGDNRNDTDGGEFVQFCCEDIPAGADHGSHDVELRVWDDGNRNGVYGDNLIINGRKDNYNTTWATIRVENKIPPVLVCPPDAIVSCDMEIFLSLDGKQTNVKDVNLSMTGAAKAFDLCAGLDVTYTDTWLGGSNPVCKTGKIRRIFSATKGAITVTCPQVIELTAVGKAFSVSFPQRGGTSEWPSCSLSLEDVRNTANATIKRPITDYGQCDIVGENITIDTFLFEDGACKKWRVTYKYINWCTGQEITTINGQPIIYYYTYKDNVAPVLTCSNTMVAANPNANNPNGGCEGSVVLTASATDDLVCAEESWVKWQSMIDLWANGSVDRIGSSFVNKAWNGIWARQDKFVAGQLNPNWVAVQNQHPNVVLADVVFVTYITPSKASGGSISLPAFTLDAENISHKVLWKITDGCGNVDQCESTVMVVDKKAPTPYCVGVSTALMQTSPKMVELWAKDFDKGSYDNCTPQSKLYFTFRDAGNLTHPVLTRLNEEHFFKGAGQNATAAEYNSGKAYKWLPAARSAGKVFTAAGKFNIDILVWDEQFNADFCTVELTIIDNGNTGSRIAGTVSTANGQPVTNVEVTFDANMVEYPKTVMTSATGLFDMTHINGMNYNVTASKNSDFANGVSTLDLVMIQRHVLGIQTLDNPYKLIAADANNDGNVTASDLTSLRKLILGVANNLPNNQQSWRFPVAGTQVQVSPIAFDEMISLEDLSSDMSGQDFVAVKIGDVNGNVSTNVTNPAIEGRSNNDVVLAVEEQAVAAGEVVEIPVTAANFNDVAGYQFTMNLNGASFVGVNAGTLAVNAANVGVVANDVVTMSFASETAVNAVEGDVLFTLVVKAEQATNVSEMININSSVTKAESYNSDLNVGNVKLDVRTAPVAGIELFQNEPNPFRGQTTVSFVMPSSAKATLSVFDVTGKVVAVRVVDAVKGLNSEIFTREQLGATGVLYYTLESGDFTATKKMIIVE